MSLYGGIDLHANNRVIVLLDEQDRVIQRIAPEAKQLILDKSVHLRGYISERCTPGLAA